MHRLLPPLVETLRGYDRSVFRSDLSAGLTVGVMLIPQGMAYALIAGMPPVYGLYAALVPLAVYALLGSSRQLAVGPVAIVSLLVAAGVGPLAGGDPVRYVELALLLALMVGVLQVGMGLLRFGFLTNLLSHPVLAGFTSAAALIIAASQLRHLVGVDLPRSEHFLEVMAGVLARVAEFHVPTLLVGTGAILGLIALQRWRKAFPAALTVVAAAILLAWLARLESAGIGIVGEVPGGLPGFSIPLLDAGAMWQLLPVALTIALVGFMESIAVAKAYATRHGYDVDPDRELVALGTANVVGAFFRAFPTTGGFSRTAVNDQAGARTPVASLVAAGVVGLTLLFLTGPFHYLPNAVLAAIVIVAVAGLVNWQEALHLWRSDRRDFALMAVTFLVTLGLGIEAGILAGVLASLGALVYQGSRPHTAVCGRLPGTNTFRNLARHPEAEEEEGVVVYRVDAGLSFANALFVRDQVRTLVDCHPDLKAFVFDFHAVTGMDSTALHHLDELAAYLRARGVEPYFAGVRGPVMDRMKKGGLRRRVGENRFFMEVWQAVDAAASRASKRVTPDQTRPGIPARTP
jgi:sulfate permease, SulP family